MQQSVIMIVDRDTVSIVFSSYAPAIRELRTIALILQMPPIASSRLIERISMVIVKHLTYHILSYYRLQIRKT